MLTLGLAAPAAAQAPDGWRLSLGAAHAVLLTGHERSTGGQSSTGLRAALETGTARTASRSAWW